MDVNELFKGLGLSPPVIGPIVGVPGDPRNNGARLHGGWDIRASAGSPVVAPGDVRVVSPFPGRGMNVNNMRVGDWGVELQDSQGRNFKLIHMGDTSKLKPGQTFKAGEQLGIVGSAVDNPHIHFQHAGLLPAPAPQGGTTVANPKNNVSLIPTSMEVGASPGLGDLVAAILQTGAIPARQPIAPPENAPQPAPPPDERAGQIAQGLGMLAGLGTPTQAAVGANISKMGEQEAERARSTVAARQMGFRTPEELTAAKEAAQVASLEGANALMRARIPQGYAEAIKTAYETQTKKPVTITTNDGTQFTVPSDQVHSIWEKYGSLQIDKERLGLQAQLNAGQLSHLASLNALQGTQRERIIQDIQRNKGVQATRQDGTPIFTADGKPLIVTASEQLGFLKTHDQASYIPEKAFYDTLEKSLLKFDETNFKISQDPTGKSKTALAPELEQNKIQLTRFAQTLWQKQDPYAEGLALTIFAKLGIKPPPKGIVPPGQGQLPSIPVGPAGMGQGLTVNQPNIPANKLGDLLRLVK